MFFSVHRSFIISSNPPSASKTSAERRKRNFTYSPACRLPDELLAAIFAIDCQVISLFASSTSSEELHLARDRHIRSVSQVCNRWRAATLSSASLWSSVNISIQIGPQNTIVSSSNPEETALWLERSRSAPLDLHLRLLCPISPNNPSTRPMVVEILQLLRPHYVRCRSLRIETISTDGLLPLTAPRLEALHLKVLGGNLPTDLSLFHGSVASHPTLTHLSVELPANAQTSIVVDAKVIARVQKLQLVDVGNEPVVLNMLTSASESLEELVWSESSPPSLDSAVASTHSQLMLPRLRTLNLSGYAPITPFTSSTPTPEKVATRPALLWRASHLSESPLPKLPSLEFLHLSPKVFKRTRRPSPSSPMPPAIPNDPLFTQPSQSSTSVLSSMTSELEHFLSSSTLPKLRSFTINGSAATALCSSSPTGLPLVLGQPEPALARFLREHLYCEASRLEGVVIPFATMPSLLPPLETAVLSRTTSMVEPHSSLRCSRPATITFTFRHAYMPDEERSVEFLHRLIDGERLQGKSTLNVRLVRDQKGIWEYGYRKLAQCSEGRVVLCS